MPEDGGRVDEHGYHRPTWQEVSRYSPAGKSYWFLCNSLVIENGVHKRVLENADGTRRDSSAHSRESLSQSFYNNCKYVDKEHLYWSSRIRK